MFLTVALLVALVPGALCGYFLNGWRGKSVLVALHLLTVAGGVVAIGEAALLVAAYGGGPILVAITVGYALGAKFRPDAATSDSSRR